MPTTYVDCVIHPGFFENEYYIVLGDSSAIVNRDDVQVAREPRGKHDGNGKLCVYVIERKADRMLVEIPGQAVVGGLRTWISQRQTTTE